LKILLFFLNATDPRVWKEVVADADPRSIVDLRNVVDPRSEDIPDAIKCYV
jgi:hypothetical protein